MVHSILWSDYGKYMKYSEFKILAPFFQNGGKTSILAGKIWKFGIFILNHQRNQRDIAALISETFLQNGTPYCRLSPVFCSFKVIVKSIVSWFRDSHFIRLFLNKCIFALLLVIIDLSKLSSIKIIMLINYTSNI